MLLIGLVIILIGAFIKEYVYIDYDYYIWIYLALNIVGLILIAAGFVYAIMNSNLKWYVWGALGLSIILSIIGNILTAIYPYDFLPGCVVSIIAFFIFAITLVLVMGYGPWAINMDLTLNNVFWFLPFLGLTVIIGILSVIFDGYSLPLCNHCDPCNPCGQCNICKPIQPCIEEYQEVNEYIQINDCNDRCNIIEDCQQINQCNIVEECQPINECNIVDECQSISECQQINQDQPLDQNK
jgi:hypothetical protein